MKDQIEPATCTKSSKLIQWKTDAWQDPRMVNWYSSRMVQSESTNHLKNSIEIETIKRFVTGSKVVDIGVGTGRAALPLIAQGYDLTGVDSSQAMLDETKRLARGAPITLKIGDISKLPCPDREFDSAIALNVLVHFPNWRESLIEWKRVVKPGGRIIFDIHSLDHIIAAYGANREHWPPALSQTASTTDFTHYMSRLSMRELQVFADEAGFSVAAVIPYGAFLGGGNVNWLMYEDLETRHRWKRVLSWFMRDQRLFEFGLFLEQSLVAWLTPRVAGRMFVVLDNAPDPAGNSHFFTNINAHDAAIDQNNLEAIVQWLPLTPAQYQAEFSHHLKPLRNRHFFYLLYRCLHAHTPAFNLNGLLPDDNIHEFQLWMNDEALDNQAIKMARNWGIPADERFKDGVDITRGTEYDLVRALFEKYFGIFTGDRK